MSFFDQHAAGIQALLALVTLLLTGVLVGTTWRYVQLTRELVRQNREVVESQAERESIRRRRKAVSLRRLALTLVNHLRGATGSLPADLRSADWDWRIDLDDVKRSALEVGRGTDRLALAAGDWLETWYREGERAAAAAEGEGAAHRERAGDALDHAIRNLGDLVQLAARISAEEPDEADDEE